MNLILVLLSLISVSALGDYKNYFFEKHLKNQSTQRWGAIPTPSPDSKEFTQKLNHLDPKDTRTFNQRYFVVTNYAESKSSPTLFYLCGESTCEGPSAGLYHFASQLKANLITIEHRYYGKSQPFSSLTTENLKYLTTDFALRDAAHFQRYAMNELGFNGKWIVAGGSYAGSLAAYYRAKYPDLVVGALASSGPVKAEENFEDYDRYVAQMAGPQCLNQIKKVVAEVESALQDPKQLAELKKLFSAEKLLTDLDFVYLVADMAALAVQYGYKDRFCGLLQSEKPIEGYAKFTQEIYNNWGINALSGSASGATSLDPTDYESSFGMRQWFYQSCTEYGYWQNAYHDENLSARSKLINLEYHRDVCRRLFGIETPTDTHKINDAFYLPLLQKSTSQIFFTNGSTDPWINLSIAEQNGNTLNSNTSHMTIEGAAHCDDLRSPKTSDSEFLKAARSRFVDLVREWIQ